MLFNSLHYAFFFAFILLTYFWIPARYRWAYLLAGSYYFYLSWKPEYLSLLCLSTAVVYWAALRIDASEKAAARKAYLALCVAANLGVLFAFKYLGFFGALAGLSFPEASLILPLGISFYTFQGISYAADVYSGRTRPERHLGRFALYVSFFPQLVAGPIERPARLLPQFMAERRFRLERLVGGAQLILWGLFKKLVIADRLAEVVDPVYGNPAENAGPATAIAVIFFSFQIYCDFSGYCDIAVGSARILGFRLTENFARPYLASSIQDFWRRWHVSLSSWFRDYLYIPLGGNRVPVPRWALNVLVTFALAGLWHGANLTFVVWGVFHFALLVGYAAWQRAPGSLRGLSLGKPLGILATWTAVTLGWVFFRAQSLEDAAWIFRGLSAPWESWPDLGWGKTEWIVTVGSLSVLGLYDALKRYAVPFYLVVALAVISFGKFDAKEFIYFQF